MADWKLVQRDPSEALARLHFFSVTKKDVYKRQLLAGRDLVRGWRSGLIVALKIELAEIPHAFGERAHQGIAPTERLEFQCALIQLDIGDGKELHLAHLGRGKFLDRDARFNFAARMLLGD